MSTPADLESSSRIETRSSALPGDVIDLVKSEHRTVEQLYRTFQTAEDAKTKQKQVHLIIKELSQHAAKEEMVLYPVMKEILPGGPQLVKHALEEHQTVKEELAAIDSLNLREDASVALRLRTLMDDVAHHVEEEETKLLPALAQALPKDQLMDLAKKFKSAESRAPSRPHPNAPNEGVMAEAANVSAKVIDALRDTARDLKKDDSGMGANDKSAEQWSQSSPKRNPSHVENTR